MFKLAVRVRRPAGDRAAPALPAARRDLLKTRPGMRFVHDADHRTAQQYGSYDAQACHNRRAVCVIDQQGRIAFAPDDGRHEDVLDINAMVLMAVCADGAGASARLALKSRYA